MEDAGSTEIYRVGLGLAMTFALLILRAVWSELGKLRAGFEKLHTTLAKVENNQGWIKERVGHLERLVINGEER
jgi:cytochrome b